MTENEDADFADVPEGPVPVGEAGQQVLAYVKRERGRDIAHVVSKAGYSGPEEHSRQEQLRTGLSATGATLFEGTLRVVNGRWLLVIDSPATVQEYDRDTAGNLASDLKEVRVSTFDHRSGQISHETRVTRPKYYETGTLSVPDDVKATLDPALVSRLYPASKESGPQPDDRRTR